MEKSEINWSKVKLDANKFKVAGLGDSFESMVRDGLVEICGENEIGEYQYRATEKGRRKTSSLGGTGNE